MPTTNQFVPRVAPNVPGQVEETTPPKLPFPRNACDAHVHLFGPQEQYPHAGNPNYIPHEASVEQLRKMLSTLGCTRAVIVQPSYYGSDNRCTVDGVKAGNGDFRGIVNLSVDRTSDAELKEMHAAGIRGVRMSLRLVDGKPPYAELARLAERVKHLGWHVQLYFYADQVTDLDAVVPKLPVDVSIDHIGYVDAGDGIEGPGFQMLLRLAKTGRAWFKLSAPNRQSRRPPLFEDVAPLARALFETVPNRCVWGTDWPHVNPVAHGITRVPNDGELADALINYLPNEADRKLVLVDNPARLYGFA
ncbi:amidohydrolase family protein [soil metagenome]